ncbi:glutamyl-tRNA(Gln) amidotransferase subunit A [Striga asiatica]|uniref:Glutamyl-tRNA(Gln) amidotransferase subunit A n=1 Tax=Striga asiatica TaxID=4170 RepID=A0A5A7QXW1_STRAF|nr:glutamyl-tRNA(Gln) amidotransferase subunit A [Striga asiatica]
MLSLRSPLLLVETHKSSRDFTSLRFVCDVISDASSHGLSSVLWNGRIGPTKKGDSITEVNVIEPLDLNDPISNLVGDSLSGFDVWGPFPTDLNYIEPDLDAAPGTPSTCGCGFVYSEKAHASQLSKLEGTFEKAWNLIQSLTNCGLLEHLSNDANNRLPNSVGIATDSSETFRYRKSQSQRVKVKSGSAIDKVYSIQQSEVVELALGIPYSNFYDFTALRFVRWVDYIEKRKNWEYEDNLQGEGRWRQTTGAIQPSLEANLRRMLEEEGLITLNQTSQGQEGFFSRVLVLYEITAVFTFVSLTAQKQVEQDLEPLEKATRTTAKVVKPVYRVVVKQEDVKNEAKEQTGPQASNLTPLGYFSKADRWKLLVRDCASRLSNGIFGSLGRIERRKTRWHIEGKAMKIILVSRTPGILIRAAYLNTKLLAVNATCSAPPKKSLFLLYDTSIKGILGQDGLRSIPFPYTALACQAEEKKFSHAPLHSIRGDSKDTVSPVGLGTPSQRADWDIRDVTLFTDRWSRTLPTQIIDQQVRAKKAEVIGGQTPYEILYGSAPLLSHLRVFGCLCYAHNQDRNGDKFTTRSRRCVFVGYPFGKKGWSLYDLDRQIFFVSRDVEFRLNYIEPQLRRSSSDQMMRSLRSVPPVSSDTGAVPPDMSASEGGFSYSSSGTFSFGCVFSSYIISLGRGHRTKIPSTRLKDFVVDTVCSSTAPPTASPEPSPSSGTPYPIAHYLSCESFSPAYRAFLAAVASAVEPRSYADAVTDPRWRAAMQDEIRALENNGTWDVVSLPSGKRAIGCKWVFKIKHKGPFRLFLAVAAAKHWEVHPDGRSQCFSAW